MQLEPWAMRTPEEVRGQLVDRSADALLTYP
jgi:hypothetical protein